MSTNPTPESDSDNPIFPDEIWANIIPRLAGDTPTLATCMKVSSSMRELAGPHLYRNVHWGKGLHTKLHPLDLYSNCMLPNTDNRVLKPKSDFFKFIRTLHIRDHTAAECKGSRMETTFEIPVLRVTATNDGNVPRDEARHLSIGTPPCLAVRNIAPRKLILDGVQTAIDALPFKEIDQRSLATLVQVFDLDCRRQGDLAMEYQLSRKVMAESSLPKAFHQSQIRVEDKRAIFIIRSLASNDISWLPKDLHVEDSGWLPGFCHGIVESASQPDFPNDIVIVNYHPLVMAFLALFLGDCGLWRSYEHNPKELMKQELSRAWAAEYHRTTMQWTMSDDRGTGPPDKKTMAEMAKVTFKLVTLAEYVKEYDWEGEYTASETEKILVVEAQATPPPTGDSEVCTGFQYIARKLIV